MNTNTDIGIKKIRLEMVGIFVTIILAISGYTYTYSKDVDLAIHKAQLERVNSQLKYLYGPLYSTTYAQERVWREFRLRNRPNQPYWGTSTPPSDNEAKEWRLWMKNVFMPLNLKMEKIILDNTDLLVEDIIPENLLDLLAHIEGYRATLAKWENNDFNEHTSFFNYPTGIEKYSRSSYVVLKKKQSELLRDISN